MNCIYCCSLILGQCKTMTFYRRPCFIRIRTINIQYTYIDTGRQESLCRAFSRLFRSECKLILYLTTMYVYCVYLVISKSPKQMSYFLKLAETSVVLNVFSDVIAYTVTVSFCRATWIRYQKCFIWPMTK